MTRRSLARRPVTSSAARPAAVLVAGLALAGVLTGCADDSQSGDANPDRQSETVPVPGEPSESAS